MNAHLRRAYLPAEPGAQIHLRVGGDGPAVLLLPDSPGSGAALAGDLAAQAGLADGR